MGNITYANSHFAPQLFDFYESVQSLHAFGGGDEPEYALYAMQQGLRAVSKESFELMVEGSQMVVLTDAPSKQKELVKDVIYEAVRRKVCIHFFTSDNYALEDGIYEQIAAQTLSLIHI